LRPLDDKSIDKAPKHAGVRSCIITKKEGGLVDIVAQRMLCVGIRSAVKVWPDRAGDATCCDEGDSTTATMSARGGAPITRASPHLGVLARRKVRRCRTASVTRALGSFQGKNVICALGASMADSSAGP
jgi:hypothetical protein